MDNKGDNGTPSGGDATAVAVRRRTVVTLIEQAAELAKVGFFTEAEALMDAARQLVAAPSSDATIIPLSKSNRRGQP